MDIPPATDPARVPSAAGGGGPVVEVEHVSVTFETTTEGAKGRRPHLRNRRKDRKVIHALRDVSFEVPHGCVYSVIGRNGAGKSTLFRVLGGIIPPAAGRVALHSRVTPLLSLGIGFNQKLTGRENALLGGLVAGLEKDEVLAKLDRIIEFSELGDAIDYPIRTYSSGMVSRLGFAVAAHLDPDLILIDEALAAGDASYKEKCMDQIAMLCAADTTVMLISHGLSLVRQLADITLWLEQGSVAMEGQTEDVVAAYVEAQALHSEVAAMEEL